MAIDDEENVLLISNSNQLYLWKEGKKTKIEKASNIVWEKDTNYINAVMNKRGQIAYVQRDPVTSQMKAVIMDLKTKEVRSLFHENRGVPYVNGINDAGDVIGYFKKQGKVEGYIARRDGSVEFIDKFIPKAISAAGVAVGYMEIENFNKGAIYQEGKLTDIHTLMAPYEQQFTDYDQIIVLTGMSDEGVISAYVTIAGVKHAVLLVPE